MIMLRADFGTQPEYSKADKALLRAGLDSGSQNFIIINLRSLIRYGNNADGKAE